MSKLAIPGLMFCSFWRPLQASEIFSSADVMESGSWALSVYGHGAETKPVVKISGVDAIQVPITGGNATIFSNANADVKMEQRASEVLAAAEFHPRDGLKYKLKVGQIRDFSLEFSSGSQTNKLETTRDGFLWGFGLGGSIAPGSIVSAAISWELAYTQAAVDLDRLQGGNVVYASDQRLRQEEYQGNVTFSRRWKRFEPYAGLKLARVVSRIQDNSTKEHVGGKTDNASPFVGLQWSVADRESVVVEGSFVDERSLTAGVKIQF